MSSFKRIWHTAAACPPWLKRQWIDWVGGDVLWEVFGGSEGVATTNISGTEWLAHPGSVGRVANGEIMIVDNDGHPVGPGEVGEIYMRDRSRPAFTNYVGDVKRRMIGDWESFGDLGWFDTEGYLFIADRRIDMIVTGGENISPRWRAPSSASPASPTPWCSGSPTTISARRCARW